MNHNLKIKLAHMTANGEKLELETYAEGDSFDDAIAAARARFADILSGIDAQSLSIDKIKVEHYHQ
ncbi:MAG: hypothetical protein ACK4VV_03950 [Pseudomonas sp.]